MKIVEKRSVTFRGEGTLGRHLELHVAHSNRGEPYREGIELDLDDYRFSIFLEKEEVFALRDMLNTLYPAK